MMDQLYHHDLNQINQMYFLNLIYLVLIIFNEDSLLDDLIEIEVSLVLMISSN
jgi:hypothetical protein